MTKPRPNVSWPAAEPGAILYFSGTGNTRSLAQELASWLSWPCLSLEGAFTWPTGLKTLIVMHPIYGGAAPILVRERLATMPEGPCDVHVIATQTLASGDGALAIEAYLPPGANLVSACLINMPNNLSNVPVIRIASPRGNRRKCRRARRRLARHITHLCQGRLRRQGDHPVWRAIGRLQRDPFLARESSMRQKVYVLDPCVGCGLCTARCPVQNLPQPQGPGTRPLPDGRCLLCFRCVNLCPHHAIGVLRNAGARRAYPGPITD